VVVVWQERRGVLGGQVRAVLLDLPVMLTSPMFRSWHLRWGAMADEVAAEMAGDELVPEARFRATRAITIAAPPEQVWPWLVQVGCGRAGWYSNDLLDNLGRPSAVTIDERLQDLRIGQWVPMSPTSTPSARNALRVESFEVDRWLLWTKPDATWSWQLSKLGDGGTRLVTRIHATVNWRRPWSAIFGVLLMELGDFAMCRRMLRGIQARAEATSSVPASAYTSMEPVPVTAGPTGGGHGVAPARYVTDHTVTDAVVMKAAGVSVVAYSAS
jgi:hypothetical protein